MKKAALFICLSSLIFSLPAKAQSIMMTDEELIRVVCNHLEQTEDTKTAIAKAYGETKNIINDKQKNTLKSLTQGLLNAQTYCADIQN
ncbi:MAG: hypothetical protein ACFCAD_05240 [Pleurocapsa sp.]